VAGRHAPIATRSWRRRRLRAAPCTPEGGPLPLFTVKPERVAEYRAEAEAQLLENLLLKFRARARLAGRLALLQRRAAGRSIFDLPVSAPPPAPSEGPGPPVQKTKTTRRRREILVKSL